MKFCKKCGSMNRYDALFCSFCEQVLPVESDYNGIPLTFEQPRDSAPASPVDVIDAFLAERNYRRMKYAFSFSVVFLVLMIFNIIGCALMLMRHSSVWIQTNQSGILIDDNIIKYLLIAIVVLTLFMMVTAILLVVFAYPLYMKKTATAAKKYAAASSLKSVSNVAIILYTMCLLIEIILLIYCMATTTLMAAAGGYAELAVCIVRLGTDIIYYPVIISVMANISRYRRTVARLPEAFQ